MNSVTAIIVTYNPNLDILKENIIGLLKCKSLVEVILVDNSLSNSIQDLSELGKVRIIHLGYNSGIAYAQNIGLKCASSNGASFAVLFDQDSYVDGTLVDQLLVGMLDLKHSGYKVAAIGPRPYDIFESRKSKPKIQKEKNFLGIYTKCHQIIASGKLIDISLLDKIGLMETELFIDGVDHEWCWRAETKGYSVFIAENVVMKHTLGDARGSFFGITYKIGSPIRLYYQFRNIILLSKRGYVPLYWKFRCVSGLLFRFFIFSFTSSDRGLRVKYMLEGLRDGLLNRYGSY